VKKIREAHRKEELGVDVVSEKFVTLVSASALQSGD
jgi:hypothetical protein